MAWGWLCLGFSASSSVRWWRHLGNEDQALGLLVEAEWVTVVEDWLQCVGAFVLDQGLASSCECWTPEWP